MNINPFGKRRNRAQTLDSLLDPVTDADSTTASGGADAKALAVFSESAAGLLLSRAAPSEAVAFMSGDMDRQRKQHCRICSPRGLILPRGNADSAREFLVL